MSNNEQNNSKTYDSDFTSQKAIVDSYSAKDKALKVIRSNHLVPNEFTYVDVTYVTSGNGTGEIQTATYYDAGKKQVSTFTPRGEVTGTSELTLIYLGDKTPTGLSQKYFYLQDTVGSVGIFWAVDGDLTVPVTGASRNIKVDILSTDSVGTITSKTAAAIDADIQFIALPQGFVAIVTSSTLGNKTNATDGNSGVLITIQDGKAPESLNNKYFKIYTVDGFYHVWYNVDAAGVDPAPAGTLGGLEVELTSNETQDSVKRKTINKINNTINFTCFEDINSEMITVVANKPGLTNDIEDGDTGFAFFKTQEYGADRSPIRFISITYNGDNEIETVESY